MGKFAASLYCLNIFKKSPKKNCSEVHKSFAIFSSHATGTV